MPVSHRKTCKRYNEVGHAHFLTFSCYNRLPLLSRERTCTWLAEAIDHARNRCEFDLWAYVFMPEHAHLLIWPRTENYSVSNMLWQMKRRSARQAIDFLKTNNPQWLKNLAIAEKGKTRYRFWQAGGGWDHNVVNPDSTHKIVDYIHLNPVRRGLVSHPVEWEWSSARWYAGIRPVRLAVDQTLPSAVQPSKAD